MKDSYFERLRAHPGFFIAVTCTLMGAVAGSESWSKALMGAAIMSVFWLPVLLTVRKRLQDITE